MRNKTLLRRVFETMVEGREANARRFIDDYLKTHDPVRPGKR